MAMQQALQQLEKMREAARGMSAGFEAASQPAPQGTQFVATMRAAIDGVNQAQASARELQTAYARGDDVNLTEVAIAMQKSSVAFEATVQVRNKLLEAYREIMNMPV